MLKFFEIQLRQFLVFFLFALAGHSSVAHLITAGNLTLNILPDKAVLLVGVPVAFFKGIDTNQDGLINDEDSCIPIGGFVNLLSPIEAASKLTDKTL